MNKVRIDKREFITPASWAECDRVQAVICAKLIMMYRRESLQGLGKHRHEYSATALRHLMKLSRRQYLAISRMVGIDDIAASINRLTEFMWKESDPLVKNHLAQFKWKGEQLTGPADKLFNITVEEFVHADKLFIKAWANPADNWIDGLIATLWRKTDLSGVERGDQRVPFNKHLIHSRYKTFKNLPQGIKDFILLWYKGCRTFIEQKHPHVFPKSNASKGGSGDSWQKVVVSMSGGKFGDLYRTQSSNLWDFLGAMEMDLKASEEAKTKRNARTK